MKRSTLQDDKLETPNEAETHHQETQQPRNHPQIVCEATLQDTLIAPVQTQCDLLRRPKLIIKR
jgi:hypothetical protein